MAVRLLRRSAGAVFVLLLPLALFLGNLHWMVLDPGTYQRGLARYGGAASTGLSQSELVEATKQLIAYWNEAAPITLDVRKPEGIAPLFNRRELDHLVDVRALFQLAFNVHWATVAYTGLFSLLAYASRRGSYLRGLARHALAGGIFTGIFFLALFALVSIDFNGLFWNLHVVSFANDLWQLDPRTDYLVRMFPQGFWLGASTQLVLWTLAEAAVVVLLGMAVLRLVREPEALVGRRDRRSPAGAK